MNVKLYGRSLKEDITFERIKPTIKVKNCEKSEEPRK